MQGGAFRWDDLEPSEVDADDYVAARWCQDPAPRKYLDEWSSELQAARCQAAELTAEAAVAERFRRHHAGELAAERDRVAKLRHDMLRVQRQAEIQGEEHAVRERKLREELSACTSGLHEACARSARSLRKAAAASGVLLPQVPSSAGVSADVHWVEQVLEAAANHLLTCAKPVDRRINRGNSAPLIRSEAAAAPMDMEIMSSGHGQLQVAAGVAAMPTRIPRPTGFVGPPPGADFATPERCQRSRARSSAERMTPQRPPRPVSPTCLAASQPFVGPTSFASTATQRPPTPRKVKSRLATVDGTVALGQAKCTAASAAANLEIPFNDGLALEELRERCEVQQNLLERQTAALAHEELRASNADAQIQNLCEQVDSARLLAAERERAELKAEAAALRGEHQATEMQAEVLQEVRSFHSMMTPPPQRHRPSTGNRSDGSLSASPWSDSAGIYWAREEASTMVSEVIGTTELHQITTGAAPHDLPSTIVHAELHAEASAVRRAHHYAEEQQWKHRAALEHSEELAARSEAQVRELRSALKVRDEVFEQRVERDRREVVNREAVEMARFQARVRAEVDAEREALYSRVREYLVNLTSARSSSPQVLWGIANQQLV